MSTMPNTLNSMWHSATTRPACAAGSPLVTATAAASSPVAVVPTFEPSMYGKTCRTVRMPAPTSGITMLVVTDELWTMNVSTMPASIATSGAPKMYLCSMPSLRPSTRLFSTTTR